MDGIRMYHTVNLGNPGNPEKAAKDIAVLLIKYFEDKSKHHIKEIEAILDKNNVISFVDKLAKIMWETLVNPAVPAEWENNADLWTDSTLDLIIKTEFTPLNGLSRKPMKFADGY